MTITGQMVVTMLMVLPDHSSVGEAREEMGRIRATLVGSCRCHQQCWQWLVWGVLISNTTAIHYLTLNLLTAQNVWKTPYFVLASSIELMINQWISVDIAWLLDRWKAERKHYSYARTLYSLEFLLVAPTVLSYSTELERSTCFSGQNRQKYRPLTLASHTIMKT